jgi:modulator of FtsH protease
MSKFLFVGVLALLIGGAINAVGSITGMLVISVAAIGIFSAYTFTT